MTPATRNLIASLLMLGGGLGSSDALLAPYARAHFVPNQVLRAALAAGEGCVLTIGDSRIAAGIDPVALESAVSVGGAHACVAPLGIGAVGIEGQTLALRAYLSAPRSPRVVVLGAGPLLPVKRIDPSDMVGNVAEELAWSRAEDVRAFYPDFPISDLDRGLRFSIARATAFQSYSSLVWAKVQGAQNAMLCAPSRGPANRFGLVEDMQALADVFTRGASRQLERWAGNWQEGAWFERIRALVHARGATLVVVHVPVREVVSSATSTTPPCGRAIRLGFAMTSRSMGTGTWTFQTAWTTRSSPTAFTRTQKAPASSRPRRLGREIRPTVPRGRLESLYSPGLGP